jgi:hypothetical protein
LNDITVHVRLTKQAVDWKIMRQGRSLRKKAFEAGMLSGLETAESAKAIGGAERACRRLAKVIPFWS